MFQNSTAFNAINNPLSTVARCSGKGTAMNFMGGILCSFLENNETCGNISGCSIGEPNIFHPSPCYGTVNLTVYGITPDLAFQNKYCTASGLQEAGLCTAFGCAWLDPADQFSSTAEFGSGFSTVSIWDSMSWVLTLRFDWGFDPFFNVIANFILGFLIPLILFAAIYYMFIIG